MDLLTCILIDDNGKERQFRFEGAVQIKKLLEFEEVSIYEKVDGMEIPFEITATCWSGDEISTEDALCDVISRYMRKESGFQVLYMHEELKAYLDACNTEYLHTEYRELPYKIRHGYFLYEYDLLLVTDAYAFYGDDESFLMLRTSTGEMLSDNYFAENALWESLEAIEKGEEQELYRREDVGSE